MITIERNKIYLFVGRIAFLLAMVVMLAVSQSCIKEELDSYAVSGRDGTGNADVLLNIGVKSVTSDDNEGICSIRIIVTEVADNGGETVRDNFSDESPDNLAEYVFKLQQVERGTRLRFYVVCNEDMLPETTQTYLEGYAAGQLVSGLAEYVVVDDAVLPSDKDEEEFTRCFPRRKEKMPAGTSIPITGISEIVEIGRSDVYVNIPVYYMVAKIQLDVTNNRTVMVSLANGGAMRENSRDSGFSADRAFLFPQAETVTPQGVSYTLTPTYWFSESGNVNANESNYDPITVNPAEKYENLLILYVYPSTVETGATYSMFIWPDNNERKSFEGSVYTGSVLDRGMHLIVNIGLGEAKTPTLSWNVKEWGPMDVDIPEFN